MSMMLRSAHIRGFPSDTTIRQIFAHQIFIVVVAIWPGVPTLALSDAGERLDNGRR
jgi:hypothetical protein